MEENDNKLSILYLITKSNFGGAQRYVFDLATKLQKEGYRITVGFGGEGTLAKKLSVEGTPTVSLTGLARDVDPFRDLRIFAKLLGLLRRCAPDVVHLNSSKIGGIGGAASRIENGRIHIMRMFGSKRKPIRIIFTGHGWALNEERPDWQRFMIGGAHWATIMLAHRTIAVSERTKEEVSVLPFARRNMSVIYNGIGKLKLLARHAARAELFGEQTAEIMSKKPLVIGTIAELHKNKGLSYALEGLAQLKKQTVQPFIFVVIGEGEERTSLEAQRETLGLTGSVFFVGFKTNASTLLSAFDIFLFTSTKEGFPYAILEAGNAGLPVVATAVGGIPEVIDDMHSGILIQSKNSGEVARALSYLIEHKDRREEFGLAIKERIEGRFNIETMVKETLTLYRQS